MFKCGVCGRQSRKGESSNVIKIAIRKVIYHNLKRDVKTEGYEAAKTAQACIDCKETYDHREPTIENLDDQKILSLGEPISTPSYKHFNRRRR